MRLSTTDGDFGFFLDPVVGMDRFFIFHVVVGGREFGDDEPCIAGSAMGRLRCPPVIEDPRLDPRVASPAAALAAIRSDDRLNDATLSPLGESLDRYDLRSYRIGDVVVFSARDGFDHEPNRMLVRSVIPGSEYDSIVGQLVQYWAELQ